MNPLSLISGNLYKHTVTGYYYQLFGHGITPNGCWIIAPYYRELRDIDIATGKYVYGTDVIALDVTGSLQSGPHFVMDYSTTNYF